MFREDIFSDGFVERDNSIRELELITRELRRLLSHSESRDEGGEYDFFKYEVARDQLAQYCEKITEYIHDNNVANIVILDRISRPVYIGIMEYWKDKYPGEKKPGIYFMNPKGFKTRESLTVDELFEIQQDCEWKDDAVESPRQARRERDVTREIEETYSLLMKDKDKPLLIFDSCIHSGDTLSPVKNTLEKVGFEKLIIGSVNPSDRNSSVETDFFITTERPDNGCYPFDRDRMIEKTFDHVYSKKNKNPREVSLAIRLRKEIKRIIDEAIAKEKQV